MKGWLLYKQFDNLINDELYEKNRLIEEAEKEHIELKIINPEQVDILTSKKNKKNVFLNGKFIPIPDFIISRMGAQTDYSTLALLKTFENLKTNIINCTNSIASTKDKFYTHQTLTQNGLPNPKTMLLKLPIDIKLIEKQFKFPLIIKPITGAFGCGVFLAKDEKMLNDLTTFIKTLNMPIQIILQEFISTSYGHDLRVITINKKVEACMLRTACKGDFRANFSQGGSVSKFKITPEIESLSVEISKLFNLDFAGIDLLFGKDHLYVCEVTSSPGFKGVESCCDVNIPKLLFQYIKNRT